MTFENPNDSDHIYIIYKDLNSVELFGGKITKTEDSILKTDLSNEEKLFIEKELENALVK